VQKEGPHERQDLRGIRTTLHADYVDSVRNDVSHLCLPSRETSAYMAATQTPSDLVVCLKRSYINVSETFSIAGIPLTGVCAGALNASLRNGRRCSLERCFFGPSNSELIPIRDQADAELLFVIQRHLVRLRGISVS
jgi:hypothetical protein